MIFRKQEKLVNYVHDEIKRSVHIRALIPNLNYKIKVKKIIEQLILIKELGQNHILN